MLTSNHEEANFETERWIEAVKKATNEEIDRQILDALYVEKLIMESKKKEEE